MGVDITNWYHARQCRAPNSPPSVLHTLAHTGGTGRAAVALNSSSGCADEAAEEYCHLLETQNEGELFVWAMVVVAGVVSLLSVVLGGIMITACCSCWCCCARPGMCTKWASPASERRFQSWSSSVSKLGLGW